MTVSTNLFDYATRELSQDAFICWLLSYSSEFVESDAGLKDISQNFIKSMLGDRKYDTSYIVTKIERQVKVDIIDGNIKQGNGILDIVVTLDNDGKNLYLIIEDKTGTQEHDNQLNKYFNAYEKVRKEDVYISYVKSGAMISEEKKELEKKEKELNHLTVVDRKTLENIVKSGITENIILNQFREKLIKNNKYIDQWEEHFGEGDSNFAFFEKLLSEDNNEKAIIRNSEIAAYKFESSRSGGFYCLSWNFTSCTEYKNIAEVYLQIEMRKEDFIVALKAKLENPNGDLSAEDLMDIKAFKIAKYGEMKKQYDASLRWEYKDKKSNIRKETKTITIGYARFNEDNYKKVIERMQDTVDMVFSK